MKVTVVLLLIIIGLLAISNPTEGQFREHIKEQQGIFGTLGLGLADLLSKDSTKGIHRENYLIFSRFYVGGDGILPKQELAWGMAGQIFDKEDARRK